MIPQPPGRDPRIQRHLPPRPIGSPPAQPARVAVIGGGIAGLAAATALAERGIAVTVLERDPQLGGRLSGWDTVLTDGSTVTMSRGFHAFFRQYYNLRALLRRADPGLSGFVPLPDYPLVHANGALDGFAGLPTYNRAYARDQHLFVNGRPVKDRLLTGAVRGAYADVLAHDRHAVVALFLECDPTFVDVNVHPQKAEVRFRDPQLVRGLIVGGLKQALSTAGFRASTHIATDTLNRFAASVAAPAWTLTH